MPAEPSVFVNATGGAFSGSICFFVRAFEGGGAQRDAILLANGLAALGHRTGILTLDRNGPLATMIDPRVPVFDLGGGQKLRMARALPALRRFLRQEGPAVFVGSEAGGNALTVLASRFLSPRPKIVLREVASPVQARRSDPYLQNRIGYRLAPLLYPRADLVVCLTQAVRQDLITHFGVAQDRAGWLGTNAVLTDTMLARIGAVPRRPEPGLVVAVGRLSPEKGFGVLLDAIAQVKSSRPVRLEIAGEGPERPSLERRIGELGLGGTVTLRGYESDVTPLLKRATVFASASVYEGYGNAIIEALACDVPVVATDAPHGPREILEDGKWGDLVQVGNSSALADAISASLDRTDHPSGSARAQSFTVESAARAFVELLERHGIALPA